MPAAEDCNYEGAPAVVWWGLAVADGPNPGNTVFSGLEDLLPHLTTAPLAARRAASAREATTEITDFPSDLGIEGVDVGIELAGQAIGLGMIERIGYAAVTTPGGSEDGQVVLDRPGTDDIGTSAKPGS